MGGLLSFLWRWGASVDPNLDVPNPVTGLSLREEGLVRGTWRIVQKDVKGNGVELFIRLFTAYPEVQKMFHGFEGVSLDKLRSSPRLGAHATGVMYALTSVVDNLDDPECLLEMLQVLGQNHRRRNVMEQHFLNLKAIVMQLLKDGCGKAMTPDAEKAWSKTLDVVNRGIFRGLTP